MKLKWKFTVKQKSNPNKVYNSKIKLMKKNKTFPMRNKKNIKNQNKKLQKIYLLQEDKKGRLTSSIIISMRIMKIKMDISYMTVHILQRQQKNGLKIILKIINRQKLFSKINNLSSNLKSKSQNQLMNLFILSQLKKLIHLPIFNNLKNSSIFQ